MRATPRWAQARNITTMATYSLLTAAGIASIFLPPLSAIDLLDRWAPVTWGILLAAGGLAGILSRILDRWAYEYLGLVPLITGTMIYAASVFGSMINYPPTWSRATQLIIVLALASLLVGRLQSVHQRHVVPAKRNRRHE